MNKTILAARAVAAEFGARLVRPMILIGVCLLVVVHGIGIWLTTIHAWWWLAEAVFIFATLVFVLLVIGSQIVLRVIAPRLNRQQKKATKAFVDKFERVTGNVGTPKFMLFYYVVRDTVQKRKNGFIITAARESTTLHTDFAKLCDLF
ncbi:MAG: hypothetical protein WBP26_01440 [Candidatus Saccharimonadales bacterium]